MSAFIWIALLLAALAGAGAYIAYLLREIQRLTEAHHARPVNGRPLPSRPRTSPVTPAAAMAHADAMHAMPRVRADLPVVRKQTDDDAPWDIPTGVQPVLTKEMIRQQEEMERQRKRAEWVRSQPPEHEADVTREDMERALAGLQAMPVYGEKSVAEVLAAEQAGRLIA